MKQEKSFFWLAILMFASGDFFYLGSLFFRSFMSDFLIIMSPEYNNIQLSSAGEATILLLTSLLGALMYLIGFLLWAISKSTAKEQRLYVIYGILTWFITDSIASIVFKFYWNVLFNLMFLVTTLVLLYLIKEE